MTTNVGDHMGKKWTCVESFCGAGGMSLGLEAAGIDVKLAFDLDEAAVATHKQGVDDRAIVADAQEIDGAEIREIAELGPGDLDLFTGGPPCQGFSKQRRGAHLLQDPRNQLIRHYARLVDELQPKAFMLENVAVFGQHRGKRYLAELEEALGHYRLYPHQYNSADFGLAQTRSRFVLVGIHFDIQRAFVPPEPTTERAVSVGEVIGDLPEPPLDYSDHPDFPNHQRARVTEKNIERFSHVPQGGGWQDIPWDLRLECHKRTNTKSGGWPDVYGRLKWDGQCPTITGGFDSFTRGRYGHPKQDRPLTPREAARLQGFPDTVVFQGTRQEVRTQIGNAVPPPLAEAIAKSVLRAIDETSPLDASLASLPPHQKTLSV